MNGQKDSWLPQASPVSGKLKNEAGKTCQLKKGSPLTSIMPTKIISFTISGSWPIRPPHSSRKQTHKKNLLCNFPFTGKLLFYLYLKKKLPVCQRITCLS